MYTKSVKILFLALFLLYLVAETLHLSHDHFEHVHEDEPCLVCIVEHPKLPQNLSLFLLFIPFFFVAFSFLTTIPRKAKITLSNKDPPFI